MLQDYNSISESDFYEPIDNFFSNLKEINLDYKDKGYCCYREKNSIWKEYFYEGKDTQSQGFKIHISSNISSYKETLTLVSNYLFSKKIAFKHLATEEFFELNQSKNEDRSFSGKFITIYPDDDEFKETVYALYDILKNIKKGPYILSDKRYKDSNIYYRYGGFKKIYYNGKLVLKTPSGEYVEDERLPYYNELPFVEDPFFEENIAFDEPSELDNYEIFDAVKFSNNGGVYLAYDKLSDKKCVLKEARPNVSYDKNGKDAVDRLRTEYYYLEKLKDIDGIVKPLGIFEAWEHTFLSMEKIEGMNLNNYLAKTYPLDDTKNEKKIEEYIEDVSRIFREIKRILKSVHERGVGIGDLSHSNIMIDDDDKVWVLDFESAGRVDEVNKGIATKGYYSSLDETNIERDEYALKKILKFMLYPVSPSEAFDKNLLSKQIDYILKKYDGMLDGDIIEELCSLDEPKSYEVPSIKELANKLFESILNYEDLSEFGWRGERESVSTAEGKYNFLNGKYGILYALSKYLDDDKLKLIKDKTVDLESEKEEIKNIFKCGLLDGKMGIAFVLNKLGYKEAAYEIVDTIDYDLLFSLGDYSFKSGLAGVGIGYLNFYVDSGNENYFNKALKISDFILENMEVEGDIGLFDGLAGVLYFESIIYGLKKDNDVLKFIKYIAMHISNNLFITNGFIGGTTNKIISPYIKDGALGILLALREYQEKTGKKVQSVNVEKHIKRYSNYGLFLDVGLYQGLMSKCISYSSGDDGEKVCMELFPRLPEINQNLYTPGKFSNKLSFDVFSGSAGILLGLNSIVNRKIDIFPIDERL
ncbi:MAG: protein kinase domain-containing protein [Ezakiella coagulans]|uniref:class III lanthionine synthetase LanKC N-terminal domain-containing protein n=1 Tax=Ezakiella coagulans TaxID=46507 RepID=UPI00399A5330